MAHSEPSTRRFGSALNAYPSPSRWRAWWDRHRIDCPMHCDGMSSFWPHSRSVWPAVNLESASKNIKTYNAGWYDPKLTTRCQLLIARLCAVQLVDGLDKVLGTRTWPSVGAGTLLWLKANVSMQLSHQLIHLQAIVCPGQIWPLLCEAVHDGKQFVLELQLSSFRQLAPKLKAAREKERRMKEGD